METLEWIVDVWGMAGPSLIWSLFDQDQSEANQQQIQLESTQPIDLQDTAVRSTSYYINALKKEKHIDII